MVPLMDSHLTSVRPRQGLYLISSMTQVIETCTSAMVLTFMLPLDCPLIVSSDKIYCSFTIDNSVSLSSNSVSTDCQMTYPKKHGIPKGIP
jgi:hypothetical protein